jgi:hypothetical protein
MNTSSTSKVIVNNMSIDLFPTAWKCINMILCITS